MQWTVYRRNFIESANENSLSQYEINDLLQYAKKLFDQNMPIIYNKEHLSMLVGYNENYINRAVDNTKKFYRYYKIRKKNGGWRDIAEPLPSLKEIQEWFLREIFNNVSVSKYAKAYVRKRSVKSNARFHLRKRVVFTIDIKDFFPSIKQELVYKQLREFGYNKEVSYLISSLCCLNGSLPQGAPTSPAISNIIMKNIDNDISIFTSNKKYSYTRYADDLTFSGNIYTSELIKVVTEILAKENLSINTSKTRTRKSHQRQEVTGIVVNKKMQVNKDTRRNLRQAMYYIDKFGFDNHAKQIGITRTRYLQHLIGVCNFILYVNPKDQEAANYLAQLRQIFINSTLT